MSIENNLTTPKQTVMFVVRAADGRNWSFAWRVWSGGTSFYLQPAVAGMKDFKISLHGPDPRHPRGPLLKLGPERTTIEPPSQARVFGRDTKWPYEFDGQPVTSTVRRVLRFNYAADLFADDAPVGPQFTASKGARKNNGISASITMPDTGGIHIDAYLADPGTDPYWPRHDDIIASNAGIGPLVNRAGQSLTFVCQRVADPHRHDPTRPDNQGIDTTQYDRTAFVRWLAMRVDDRGLMWLTEKYGPEQLDETSH